MASKPIPAPTSASAASIANAIARGADRFQELLRDLAEMSNSSVATMLDDDEHYDPRDYRAMADVIRANVAKCASHSDPAYQVGYLRAMTDFLVTAIDSVLPGRNWDPLRTTEATFAAPAEMRAVVERVRSQLPL